MKRPNIVYILTDDLGYGDLGCYNEESKIPTPNLDQLASEGIRFEDAHASSAVCTPSRYGIMTGRYCFRGKLKARVLWPWDEALIEKDRKTVPKLLQEAGYQTACIGKWHLGWDWKKKDGTPAAKELVIGEFQGKRHEVTKEIDYAQEITGGPVDCGFDYYFGIDVPNFPPYAYFENRHLVGNVDESDYLQGGQECFPGPQIPGWKLEEVSPELSRRAVDYVKHRDKTKPFFLMYTMTAPHTPIVPIDAFKGTTEVGAYGDYVHQLDHHVGELLTCLKEEGLEEDTLIIFTSDNGPEHFAYARVQECGHYSMGDLRGVKRDLWEGGHRVPFIVKWKGVTPEGMVSDELISLLDLMATVSEIVGIPLDEYTGEDSLSMLEALKGRSIDRTHREGIVYHSCFGNYAIRKEDWIYIEAETGSDNKNEPEWFRQERGYEEDTLDHALFYVKEDKGQSQNVALQYPEKVNELRVLLNQYKSGSKSTTF